jgi:hypothetical protein
MTPSPSEAMPELPEWCFKDDLGGLVPSQIRVSVRAYGDARERSAVEADTALLAEALRCLHPLIGKSIPVNRCANDIAIRLGRERCAEIKATLESDRKTILIPAPETHSDDIIRFSQQGKDARA